MPNTDVWEEADWLYSLNIYIREVTEYHQIWHCDHNMLYVFHIIHTTNNDYVPKQQESVNL